MPNRRLEVWLDGVHVANVERRSRSDLRLRLSYTREALERWPLNAPVVSCSLPLTSRPADAVAFLRGLLPEGDALAALAARARTSVIDTFGLLERYGRDVAGALVIADGPPDESRFDLEAYDDATLAEEVDELDRNPLGVHDDSELSLAGLQNKLLLVRDGEGWARPVHGRPSTHILKAEDRRFPGLAQAEADCLRLAAAAGLSSGGAEVRDLAGIPCLIVARYDRCVATDGSATRVHQEDLCQALGVDGADNRGRRKYQRRGGGGPGFAEAAGLLDTYAEDPTRELAKLVAVVAFTIAIGNADAHAKNLSFLHETVGAIRLAPLYDTVPTFLWPSLTREAAMSVNGRFELDALTLADVVAEAAAWPLEPSLAERTAVETIERVLEATAGVATDQLAAAVNERCHAFLGRRAAVPGPALSTIPDDPSSLETAATPNTRRAYSEGASPS